LGPTGGRTAPEILALAPETNKDYRNCTASGAKAAATAFQTHQTANVLQLAQIFQFKLFAYWHGYRPLRVASSNGRRKREKIRRCANTCFNLSYLMNRFACDAK
jgi:hypothetical protein